MKKLFALLMALVMLGMSGVLAAAESTTAWLYYADYDYWPSNQSDYGDVAHTDAIVDGEGEYTVGISFDKTWAHKTGTSGVIELDGSRRGATYFVIENGRALFPDCYVQITDIRIDDQSVSFNDNVSGVYNWGEVGGNFNHIGVPLLVGWKDDTWTLDAQKDWSGNGTTQVLTNDQLIGFNTLFVDFKLTSKSKEDESQPDEPAPPAPSATWYPNNTQSVVGYSLRDMGIGDKWYHVVPVDLTKDATYVIPMAASNMVMMGEAIVAVEGGKVTVTYQMPYASYGNLTVNRECLAWFDEIEDVTEDFVNNPQSDLAFGEAYDISDMGNVAYLFICNGVSYRQPITDGGSFLPRYCHNNEEWVAYRQNLDAIVETAEAVPAEEVAPAAEEEVEEEAVAVADDIEGATAWLYFADSDWWPSRNVVDYAGNDIILTDAKIIDEGKYTVGFECNPDNHPNGMNGISWTYIQIADGTRLLPGYYYQITDIRINGESVPFKNNLAGTMNWDEWDDGDGDYETAIPLYISWFTDESHLQWNRTDWSGSGTTAVMTAEQFVGAKSIYVDFIVSKEAGPLAGN